MHRRRVCAHRWFPNCLWIFGKQVKPLLPSRSTTMLPRAPVSTILADFATSVGPADARRASQI
jgi:hypothetical protein